LPNAGRQVNAPDCGIKMREGHGCCCYSLQFLLQYDGQ
jgi:hypothetical protein